MSSSSAVAASSSAVVPTEHDNTNNNDNNNPLLKIWSIQRVLLFVQQNGIVYFPACVANFSTTPQTKIFESVPRLFQLKDVTSSWNETVEHYIDSIPSDVIVRFCKYLQDFVDEEHSSEKRATLARDAFLWNSKFIADAESVEQWCNSVYGVIWDNEKANCRIFGTEQVRDAFVGISEFAASNESVCDWSNAFRSLTQDDECNQKLFGTTEILNCFVSLSKIVTSKNTWHWCGALRSITKVKENQQLFGTEDLRDSFIHVGNIIRKKDDGPDSWLKILDNILTGSNESNKELFLVEALQDEKERIEKIQ